MGEERFTFGNRADLNKVAALMEVVKQVRGGEIDKAFAAGDAGGLSSTLVETIAGMGADESSFLDQLVEGLESEGLYDDYNPRLYYL